MITLYRDGGQIRVHPVDSEWWILNGWATEAPQNPETTELIQINQLTLVELDQLPGVSPTIAKKVFAARPIPDLAALQQIAKSVDWSSIGLGFDTEPSRGEGTGSHQDPES